MDGKIVKLPDSTIQKIAAGEVITRPVNVVKELLENSIDAGATNINIRIEQGGLKLIEIKDNGHGIAKANAELLCKRYATSKLSTADDLTRIGTFGFRGEALSSISEMATVQVRSFNMNVDQMGWEGDYKCGLLCGAPVERYIETGTQIKVKDLFSTVKSRKYAMSNSFLDEKKAITDLVMKFAIHHRDTITISLSDATVSNELVCSLAPMSIRPSIGSFFGLDMENNLIDFSIEHNDNYKASIYIAFSYKKSSTNTHQSNVILFINDRLVECDELKRELNALIMELLNIRQIVSMLYISLDVPPQDIDVNTHPAKSTVSLHYQQEIISLILTETRLKFRESLDSTTIVAPKIASQRTIGELIKYRDPKSELKDSNSDSQPNEVLSQANQPRLRLLAPGSLSQPTPVKRPYELIHNDSMQPNISQITQIPPSRVRRDLKLRSIHQLREQVAREKSLDNIRTIKNSVFVGLFDHDRALIQHDTKFYAINLKAYLKEQIYQFYLFDFGNFPPIDILPPGNKTESIIEMYLDDIKRYSKDHFDSLTYKTTNDILVKLTSHSKLLQDYITLEFTRSELFTIPCIIPDHVPNMNFLGRFLVDLANKVNYEEERDCFHKLGRVIADFYSEPPANLKDIKVQKMYHHEVDTRLYDAIKRYLLVPDWLFTKQNICQITDTKDLYKVFERC